VRYYHTRNTTSCKLAAILVRF